MLNRFNHWFEQREDNNASILVTMPTDFHLAANNMNGFTLDSGYLSAEIDTMIIGPQNDVQYDTSSQPSSSPRTVDENAAIIDNTISPQPNPNPSTVDDDYEIVDGVIQLTGSDNTGQNQNQR